MSITTNPFTTTTRFGELRLPWGKAAHYPRIEIAQRLIRRLPPYPWLRTDDDLAASLRVTREFARGLVAGLVYAGVLQVETAGPEGCKYVRTDRAAPELEPVEDTIAEGFPA